MTAHWIKVEKDTPSKPEVMRLAALLDIDEFTVVGHLIAFWSWVDSNLSPECPRTQGTIRGLDRIAGRAGFCEAMIAVGWLSHADGMFEIPKMGRHMGKSAKMRAEDQEKKQRKRDRQKASEKRPPEQGTKSGQEGDETGDQIREDKRRKEENTETQAHAAKPVRCVFRKPSVQDVQEYVTSICANVDAVAFVDYYTANGWKVGRSGMKDWKAAVRNWHKRNEEQQSNDHGQQAVKAGFTAQARQDAQWAVFREFDAAATRDAERAIAGSADGSPARIASNHASLFGEESSTDDPF